MNIGMNIRRLREERGFTQEKLAEQLNVSFQAVSAWEREEYKPDLDNLIKLTDLQKFWMFPYQSLLNNRKRGFKRAMSSITGNI